MHFYNYCWKTDLHDSIEAKNGLIGTPPTKKKKKDKEKK